ncbi:hypothetical protein BD779DRAFT_1575431 [Infundibulicybe gibba]|nr:hypothetical protein BD779DRAFT_1606347 [Infundibulicybe gibba]KAF8871695.1 hypothetical protein BD779DRAFT_1575431 [Infundibulicybe gibba]
MESAKLPTKPTSAYISAQPGSAPTMNVSPDVQRQQPTRQEAMRLRGGCVPCPVGLFSHFSFISLTNAQGGGTCCIIPLPCCC